MFAPHAKAADRKLRTETDMPDDESKQHEEEEAKEAEERSAPSGSVVYKAIRSEGESELERATSALAWSGLAAGLSMGFSFVGESLLHAHLPNEEWRPLLTAFGYSLGFLIVVLGRQQLFTENTLTVILPLLAKRDGHTIANVGRLWITVLLANLAGAFLFALVLAKLDVVEPDVYRSMVTLGAESLNRSFAVVLLRGIFAGWLIALMVWLLPFAETARVGVIIIITWLVGAAHLSHVIAGAVSSMFTALTGHASSSEVAIGFFVPALLGNIIGGVSLVAAIAHAQVVAGEEGADV
jgi:formate/nitrite transporter FocA (FNT family)